MTYPEGNEGKLFLPTPSKASGSQCQEQLVTPCLFSATKSEITKPWLMNSGSLQVVSPHVMAHSEQVRVTKRQQDLRKSRNSRVTAGLGEDNSEHPCSRQWHRGFPAPGSLSWGSSSETPTPRDTPHTHETKAVQPWFTCWRRRVGSTEYALSHEET